MWYEISLIVPSTVNVFGAASKELIEDVLRAVRNEFNSFGGCTSVSGVGSYISAGGEVLENVVVVSTFTEDCEHGMNVARATAQHVKDIMSQESVLVTCRRVDIVEFI